MITPINYCNWGHNLWPPTFSCVHIANLLVTFGQNLTRLCSKASSPIARPSHCPVLDRKDLKDFFAVSIQVIGVLNSSKQKHIPSVRVVAPPSFCLHQGRSDIEVTHVINAPPMAFPFPSIFTYCNWSKTGQSNEAAATSTFSLVPRLLSVWAQD